MSLLNTASRHSLYSNESLDLFAHAEAGNNDLPSIKWRREIGGSELDDFIGNKIAEILSDHYDIIDSDDEE